MVGVIDSLNMILFGLIFIIVKSVNHVGPFTPIGNKLFQGFFSGVRGVIVEYWDLILLFVCPFPTVTAGRVRSLSTALWSLTHLTALHLSDNSLSRIPPDIAKLHNLVYLDLSSNKIRSLPAELGNMVSLR